MSKNDVDFKGALLDAPQLKLDKAHYDRVIATKGDRTLGGGCSWRERDQPTHAWLLWPLNMEHR